MARGQAVARKAQIKSSPSPNRVPYRVYKRCPKVLTSRLLLQAGLCQKCIFKEWRKANRTYVPKQLNSIAITQSRPISLLNIERKCSQPWQEVRKFLTVNKYVDRVVQRGGAPTDAEAKTERKIWKYKGLDNSLGPGHEWYVKESWNVI